MLQDQWLRVAAGAEVARLPGDHAREHYLPSSRKVPVAAVGMLALMRRPPCYVLEGQSALPAQGYLSSLVH